MPLVMIPTAYRAPTLGQAEVEVAGETVLDCLRAVEARFPGFLELVLDAQDDVHPFVKLFVNGDQIAPADLGGSLSAQDRVEVLAAIAGG
jgi:molybdopterin converting factor small subunit